MTPRRRRSRRRRKRRQQRKERQQMLKRFHEALDVHTGQAPIQQVALNMEMLQRVLG